MADHKIKGLMAQALWGLGIAVLLLILLALASRGDHTFVYEAF